MEKLITFDKCLIKELNNSKYVSKHPEYKNVSIYRNTKTSKLFYKTFINNNNKGYTRNFDSDRDAAKWIDLKLIEFGKNPVNILKKK